MDTLTNPKVLLVDDERLNIRVLDEILRDTYNVSVALSGEEALEIARAIAPDIILLDIQMPGMNGYEVCRQLMADEATQSIPIIFVTAMTEKADEHYGLSLGAVDYITKPFHPAIILARLKNHLRLQQLNRDLARQVEQEVALRMAAQKQEELSRQILIQQSKMAEMGAMLGAISHQWQQPLCAISIITESITSAFQQNALDQAYIYETTEDIMYQIKFMTKTMDDFRNFFKPSKERKAFSLVHCIREVYALVTKDFDLKNITVLVDGDENIRVTGYQSELKQVILNVLNNAKDVFVERSIRSPQIRITVLRRDQWVEMTLCDTGGGIPASLLPDHLFEPFESTKGERGTGIGLSLARQIVERMDGTIVAHNTAEGACFTITLPLAQEDI